MTSEYSTYPGAMQAQPAYEMKLKKLRSDTCDKLLEYECVVALPIKVQEYPLVATPVRSPDGHYLIVALFEEPRDNCGALMSKDFVVLK